MSNKVLITNDQNVVKVPSGLRILIRRSCNAVLDFEHFDGPAEISVTFVDNNRIHELNREYRGKDSATDVLSFPLGENGEYDIDEDNGCKLLGDIVISMERAMEQAELYGHSLQREVAYLTVHSMLHLLGYDHVDEGPMKKQMRAAEEAILAEIDLQMSTYRDDSLIEQFNRAPAGTCQAMPRGVLELVRAGDRLHQESQGYFDLTLEPLLDLWGFGPQSRGERVPTAEEIAEVRQRIGHQHLRIDGEQLCKDAAVEVDFNSIAAGYAVDTIAARLEALGIHDYLAEATGELKAAGNKLDGSPWRIALEEPRDDQQVAERVVAVDGFG